MITFNFISCSIFAEENEVSFEEKYEKIWTNEEGSKIVEKAEIKNHECSEKTLTKAQRGKFIKYLKSVADELTDEAFQRLTTNDIILGTTHSERQGKDCTWLIRHIIKEKLPQKIETYLIENNLCRNKTAIKNFVEAFYPEDLNACPSGMSQNYFFSRFNYRKEPLYIALVDMFTAKCD